MQNKESLSLYKRIILYMLSVGEKLTNNRIVDFILGGNYTDYFRAQETIHELLSEGLITSETSKLGSIYSLTDDGEAVSSSLNPTLDASLRQEIDEYLSGNGFEVRSEASLFADYQAIPGGKYTTKLIAKDKGLDLISIDLMLEDEESAKHVCAKWKEKSENIYAYIIKELSM